MVRVPTYSGHKDKSTSRSRNMWIITQLKYENRIHVQTAQVRKERGIEARQGNHTRQALERRRKLRYSRVRRRGPKEVKEHYRSGFVGMNSSRTIGVSPGLASQVS